MIATLAAVTLPVTTRFCVQPLLLLPPNKIIRVDLLH